MSIHKYKRLGLKSLLDILVPVPISSNRPHVLQAVGNIDMGWGRLFGGQMSAQSLAAALTVVPKSVLAYSHYTVYMREGSMQEMPTFTVDVMRNGKSFANMRVRAEQSHGIICESLVSTHVLEEGYEHELDMPDEKDPDALGPNRPRYEKFIQETGNTVPLLLQNIYMDECQPVLMRPATFTSDCEETHEAKSVDSESRHWFRMNGAISGNNQTSMSDEQLSQICVAFSSDFRFLNTSLLPHGITLWKGHIQPASLSHALYFHRPFVLNDWCLFNKTSPSASGARGFVRGTIFDRASKHLVASGTQEGLIRPRTRQKTVPGRSLFS